MNARITLPTTLVATCCDLCRRYSRFTQFCCHKPAFISIHVILFN